jgi:hypothetical protein
MNRALKIACLVLATTLLPAGAEARKMRFGGGKTSPTPATSNTSRGLLIIPGVGLSSRAAAAQIGKPERAPFPPATTAALEPTPLRLTINDDTKKPWCRSDVVVGGFCVVN